MAFLPEGDRPETERIALGFHGDEWGGLVMGITELPVALWGICRGCGKGLGEQGGVRMRG